MSNTTKLPPVSRETLVKWAMDQKDLEIARLEYPHLADNKNTRFYVEGRRDAFEKIIRVFGPEEV
jgi:hypothetical protein